MALFGLPISYFSSSLSPSMFSNIVIISLRTAWPMVRSIPRFLFWPLTSSSSSKKVELNLWETPMAIIFPAARRRCAPLPSGDPLRSCRRRHRAEADVAGRTHPPPRTPSLLCAPKYEEQASDREGLSARLFSPSPDSRSGPISSPPVYGTCTYMLEQDQRVPVFRATKKRRRSRREGQRPRGREAERGRQALTSQWPGDWGRSGGSGVREGVVPDFQALICPEIHR